MAYRFLYVMVPDKAAGMKIARTLVQEKKVACANVMDGATSVYWWEGKMEESAEAMLIAKTTADLVGAAIDRIKEIHSYSCPGVVSLRIDEGNVDYLNWIKDSVKG